MSYSRVVNELPSTDSANFGPVLVVEDEAEVRHVIALLLAASGYEVVTAANGEEALAELRRIPSPSLMLLDLSMPVMDGWQFIEARRQDAALLGIPVVIVSAVAGTTRSAPYAGISAIVEKPFDPERLLATVRRFARPAATTPG